MREHFNLYYLFMEDKLKNPMPEGQRLIIREKIQKISESNKTNLKNHPP